MPDHVPDGDTSGRAQRASADGARAAATSVAHRSRMPRRAVLSIAAVMVIAGMGVGGYAIGRTTGADVDQARQEGLVAGEREGAAKGAQEGYDRGFRLARQEAYRQSFSRARKRAYDRAIKAAK